MVKENMEFLKSLDSEIGEAVEKEFARQSRNIELIASENIVSEAVLAAAGTVLTNKYAEGYPGKRYYGGCANALTLPRSSQEKEHVNCSARTTPTFSPIQALTPTLPFTPLSASPATRLWA